MSIAKAHISYAATSLGASFGYYSIERYNELLTTLELSTPGWQRIAKVTTEGAGTLTYDDYEGRYTVAESYRVQVVGNLGGPSVPVAATILTKTVAANQGFVIVSNENPAINQTVNLRYGPSVNLPERMTTSAVVGRYGQRQYRSTDPMGEAMGLTFNLTGTNGPALWRTLVSQLRSNLSYVCLLSPWGDRWFAGMAPTSVAWPWTSLADLAVNMVEVTDTPAVVTS